MSKAAEAFRTIGEVADDLDVPKHVLRFWEGKFPHIRPMKRGGGRRYYRPEDLELLRGIRHLLHAEGYTIKGVQKILREQGIDEVKAAARAAIAAKQQTGKKRGRKDVEPTGARAIEVVPAKVAVVPTPAAAEREASANPTTNKDIVTAAIKELELCREVLLALTPRAATAEREALRVSQGR